MHRDGDEAAAGGERVADLQRRLPVDLVAPDLPALGDIQVNVGFGGRVKGAVDAEIDGAVGVVCRRIVDTEFALPADAGAHTPAAEKRFLRELIIGDKVCAILLGGGGG